MNYAYNTSMFYKGKPKLCIQCIYYISWVSTFNLDWGLKTVLMSCSCFWGKNSFIIWWKKLLRCEKHKCMLTLIIWLCREELQSIQRELEVLSEQYSQKCLENAHLAQALEAERQALRQYQRENQELNAHNQVRLRNPAHVLWIQTCFCPQVWIRLHFSNRN